MTHSKNTLITLLGLLGVKHTEAFSDQYFNEHPHKYNLFGLSKMLSDYGIQNAATRISDKENDITEIQTPFIAQFSGDFVTVNNVDLVNVSFLWKGVRHVLTLAKFIEAWTGIILLVETSEKSIEPDYKEHKKVALINLLKKIVLFTSLGLIATFAFIYNMSYMNLGTSLLITVNLAGLYISWLLLLKQMNIQSQYADKICSLFKQKDCNNVLESKAAKLFGIIGWSEIGFGYFLTNFLTLLFFPTQVTTIALVNVITLPYTVWSVWYQQAKAKQWCVLCLIVQILLWSIFIINLSFYYLQFPTPLVIVDLTRNLIVQCLCYGVSVLAINMLVPKLNTEKTRQSIQQSLNSMKANEDVFVTLLKKQPFYETVDCDSIIRFGNPESSLKLTVLSNPYCNPCALMHKRIEKLLQDVKNNISVQYILSSFGENLNSTNKFLIAFCIAEEETKIGTLHILNDWFEKGKVLKDEYFNSFSLDMENPEIEAEFQKHEAWKAKTQLRATPTILVNGFQLPESYKIEDLRYFTTLDL